MENMVFVVRKAVIEDTEKILLLAKDSFKIYIENAKINGLVAPLNETYEDVKKDIETKEVFVALIDEEIIGSVRVEIKPDNTAYLSRFGVAESYQNHGIGKLLMTAVDKAMEELGIIALYLHTASRLFSLIKFYYGRGFYIESTTKDRGYVRALLCKEYEISYSEDTLENNYESLAVM